LTAGKYEEVHKHGILPVITHRRAGREIPAEKFYGWPMERSPASRLREGIKGITEKSAEAKWAAGRLRDYYAEYDYWVAFFDTYAIKLYTSWYKYDAQHCVIADAIKSLGDISTVYQRAFEELPSADAAISSDIVFGFSALGAEVEKAAGSFIPYYVMTGYIGDHRFPLLRSQAQAIRQKLQSEGAEFILAFFDEGTGFDPRWGFGPDFLGACYAFFLEKVLSEPWLGLVLKPKIPSTLRKRIGPVAEILDKALRTGRCYMFEEGTMHGSYPPAAAALAADVAIHGHLSAGTAGLESYLAGCPTLLIDPEGWKVSQFYKWGEGRVVFPSLKEAWKTCLRHRQSPGAIPGFGDWGPMRSQLDPFRDGRGMERMGTYLQWLLEGYKKGLSRDDIMAKAADRYKKQWGHDKVVTL